MIRITIANQSVICNDHTVYFTTEYELGEYALLNDYTVLKSSCEYNCVSYDLDTDEDYYYDCHVYYAC